MARAPCSGPGLTRQTLSRWAQVGLAVYIVVVTAVQLQNITWDNVNSDIVHTVQSAQCLLGKSFNSTSLCTYTYIAAGASIGASLLLSLLLVRLRGSGL